MTDALVTITNPKDPSAQIPFIWGQAPLRRVVVASWVAKSLSDLGFEVEIHEEPYDPVAVHNGTASYQPVVAPAEPAVEEVEAPIEPVVEEEAAPVVEAEVSVEETVVEETAVEETVVEEAAIEETASEASDDTISDEELAELRSRIEALSSVAAANQLAEEYGMAIPEGMTKLKDIKAHLLSFTEVA